MLLFPRTKAADRRPGNSPVATSPYLAARAHLRLSPVGRLRGQRPKSTFVPTAFLQGAGGLSIYVPPESE